MSDSPASAPPPAPAPPPATSTKASNLRIIFAVAFLAVAGIALFFIMKMQPAQPAAILQGNGKEYWLTVTSAEVAATKKDGKAWDGTKTGPDVYYEIWWQGNRVYQSSTCTDTLIAKWDTQEIDLTKVLRTRRLEAAKAGAIVKLGDKNTVTLKVYDSDVTFNDLIDEYQIDLATLKAGINAIGPGPTKQCLKLSLVMAPVEE